MSPHYIADPSRPIVVSKDQWNAVPWAVQENQEVAAGEDEQPSKKIMESRIRAGIPGDTDKLSATIKTVTKGMGQ